MAPTGAFSIGISPEEKLSMPLDALIQKTKTNKKTPKNVRSKVTTDGKPGKKGVAPTKKSTPPFGGTNQRKAKGAAAYKKLNVKQTVMVPISKAARARVNYKVGSTKRQAVMNMRRPGLVVAKQSSKRMDPTVQLRHQQTSALRMARAASKKQRKGAVAPGGLDVSNILNHFRTHPNKFDVPKGSNLRITINLNNVKPVVGAKK